MYVICCHLVLHDSVYYATREMGTLYETERYFHNYALSYALFNGWQFLRDVEPYIAVPYFCNSYRPSYLSDLAVLNKAGIYVTPARPLTWSYLLVTWKMAQVDYYRKSEKFGGKNYPVNIGRAKELAPDNVFEFFIISNQALTLPHWIRLGKWMSKVEVEVKWQAEVVAKQGDFIVNHPLNPLDVPITPTAFDLISMPPVSLISNVRFYGEYYQAENIRLPANMRYTFPEVDK